MMTPEEEKLMLGKGVAFFKSRLKLLPQSDDTWEADFQAVPKSIKQTKTHYIGMVVGDEDSSLLADLNTSTGDPRSSTSPPSWPTP